MLNLAAKAVTANATPVPPLAAAVPALQVLVVDDEPEIAELLRELLEAAGYGVTTAHCGAAALRLVQAQHFDAIVSDLRMPDTDGAALWREVQALSPLLSRRMLFVTGDTLSLGARTFLAESGCPSLEKPFRRADLLLQLARLAATALPH
jgi:CheY-like chemotaxis protein